MKTFPVVIIQISSNLKSFLTVACPLLLPHIKFRYDPQL